MTELTILLLFVMIILMFILILILNKRIDSLLELYKLTNELIDIIDKQFNEQIKYVDKKIDTIDTHNDKSHSNFIELIKTVAELKK